MNEKDEHPLCQLFNACGECRLEVGGPEKYRILTEDEIKEVLAAFEGTAREERFACR